VFSILLELFSNLTNAIHNRTYDIDIPFENIFVNFAINILLVQILYLIKC